MPERVAIVTGAARGMGLAIATRLLEDGYAVLGLDVNARAFERNWPALEAAHPDHTARLEGSVTDAAALEAAVERCRAAWGGLDVLVNNAGLNRPGGMFDLDEAGWDAVLAVNLKAAWLAARAVARAMRERGGGAIVSIGSVAGAGVGAGSPAYAASKAGLVGLSRTIAHELGPWGIRVNVVAPGVTTTEWVERHLPAANLEATRARTPLRRIGAPEDVAAAVAFLASDDARHITGQVISVSGGEWMH
jgi:3-oxoacyl-[acyl-carrier protein] reductase